MAVIGSDPWLIRPSQPIMADEIQMFKALIVVHKVLQEGHPVVLKEAQVCSSPKSLYVSTSADVCQGNIQWLDSIARGVHGDGLRGGKFFD